MACTLQTGDEGLFRAADVALYTAKRQGRNRSVAYRVGDFATGASAGSRD